MYLQIFILAKLLILSEVGNCKNIGEHFEINTKDLIIKLQNLENCAKPVPLFLDKVYSNLRYRANRLKICVGLVKGGNNGFNCLG